MNSKFVNIEEALSVIKDNDTIATSGFVQVSNPEALEKALGEKFERENSPKNLTLFYCAGQGDGDCRSINHFAKEGLLKKIIAGHFNMAPKIGDLIFNNKIEGYNIPQGALCAMLREYAAKKVGVITHVGLGTFADPRLQGCKINEIAKDDVVELITIDGEEKLFFRNIPLDVALIKGSIADTSGNISMELEAVPTEVTSLAQAVHNNGGKVIVQVNKVVAKGELDPKLVKIPGIYVDYIVEVSEDSLKQQCYDIDYEPELAGNKFIDLKDLKPLTLDAKKIIARRAAMEISRGDVGNLGIGVPELIGSVVAEEGISDWMTLTVEAGPVGGIPQSKNRFGSAINADCILDSPYQFDFYDGGGLDICFLGLGEADRFGNLNVSKFNGRIAGCGGFIDISQNAKKAIFCGTFTAGGLKTEIKDGKLNILQEGKIHKFVRDVEQITFSGQIASNNNKYTLYITERAVFKLVDGFVELIEIAPGVDLEKDILAHMDFLPIVSENLKTMDERIFKNVRMNLSENKKELVTV